MRIRINIHTVRNLTLALIFGATFARAGNDTWTGNGTDDNWMTAANWSPVATPSAGDSLYFSGSTQLTNNNNFPAATSFAGLNFDGNAGKFVLDGNQITTTGAVLDNSLNPETINLPIVLGVASHSLKVVSGGSLLVGGVISDGGLGYGINASGPGLVTLTDTNTYIGATTANSGTLTLDFIDGLQSSNIISTNSPLAMGGGTLDIIGCSNTASSQTFSNTTFNAGYDVISSAPVANTNYPDIFLGTLTANVGAAVVFYGPPTTNVISTNSIEATNDTTTSAGSVGFGGNGTTSGTYATVGLYDWAGTVSDPISGNDIEGGTQIPGFYTEYGTGNGTQQSGNADFTASTAGSHNTETLTSIRFNVAGGCVWTLASVCDTGGILVTPTVGANNVYIVTTGETLQPTRGSGAGTTVIFQNNVQGYLDFSAGSSWMNNAKNGNGTVVLAGLGTVELAIPASYSGPTYINGPAEFYISTSTAGDGALGAPASATIVDLNGGTIIGGANFALDNAGANPRPIALGNNGGALAAAAGTTITVDGVIGGSTPLTIGIPANTNNGNVLGLVTGSNSGTNPAVYATGIVLLTGANTNTGGTVVQSGILGLGTNNASLPAGGLTINNGGVQWRGAGNAPDISAQTVSINGPTTLDHNANTVTLAGSIGNGGSGAVTVINSGAADTGGLFLNGGISYTGGTTVSSGAVLGSTGTIAGNVTWSSGAYAALSATTPTTVSGTVTLNNTTVNVLGSGLTTGSYTLLTAGTMAGGSSVNPVPGGSAIADGYAGTVSISGNSVILTVTQLGVSASWTDALGDQNWSEGGNWSGGTAPHNPGDAAYFGSGGVGSPVDLNASETVGALSFTNASSYTITGANTLTLDNSGHPAQIGVTAGTANAINTPVDLNDNLTATVNAGDSLAFGGTVANGSSQATVAVTGGGTLILSGTNTYGPAAGLGTTIAGSTVEVGNNASLSTGNVSVTGSGTLSAGAAGLNVANNIGIASLGSLTLGGSSMTISGIISGPAPVTMASGGTLTVNGANNTYTGGTTLSAGVVSIASDGSAGSAGSLGEVPATETANNVNINGGDLLATATTSLGATRDIGIGQTSPLNTGITTALLDAATGQTLTVPGVIASAGNIGTNNLTVNSLGGTGTVALGGANTFNGTNVIMAGKELLENALALQNSELYYNGQGGVLDFGALTNATIGGIIGSQNLSLVNDSAGPVALTLAPGGNALYTGMLTDGGAGGSLTINGAGVQQIGAGSSGGASYTGGTVLNEGSLVIGGHVALSGKLDLSGLNGTCNFTLQDSAMYAVTGTVYVADAGAGTTQVIYAQPGTVTLLNNAVLSAPAFSFGNTTRVEPGCSVTITNNGFMNITGNFELEDSEGTTTENNEVNLNGGTLGAGSFTETYATAGSHQATINFNGGVLLANSNDPSGSQYLPDLTALTVNVTNTTIPAYINTSNYWITIANPLTDASGGDAGLVKLGTGTLVLSGANNYTGTTVVSNGTVLVSGQLNDSSENFSVNDHEAFGAYFDGSDDPQIGTLTMGNSSGDTTLLFTNLSNTGETAFGASSVVLNGPCTVKIADMVNITVPNEYPLFNYGSGITTNSGPGFSLSLPAGLHGVLTNDTSINAVALLATSISVVPPYFNRPVVSGANLVLSASGGTPNDAVNLLSTTNLALPLSEWTTVTSGNYDGNGDFSYTVTGALSSGLVRQFYVLQGK